MSTLQDGRDLGYAILRENEDTTAYPLVLMDSLLNMAQSSICSGSVQNLLDKETIEKGPLPFLYESAFYSTVQDTFLDGEATVGGATLDVSSATNNLTSGKLWIGHDIITYTGVSTNTFTGVSGISFGFAGGTRVSQLFDLPSDYHTPVRFNYNGQIDLISKDYRNLYKQLDQYKTGALNSGAFEKSNLDRFSSDIAPFYTVIQGKYILPFQIDTTGDPLHLLYEKKATKMTTGTDDFTIPDEYADIVPYLAVGEFLYNRGEEGRALELLRFAYGKIKEMYTYYNNQNSEDIYTTRVTTGKDQAFNL